MKDIFVTIKSHPDYEINKDGKIRKIGTDIFRKSYKLKDGHEKIVLNGKTEYISRLVAESFLKNENELTDVVHLDKNKSNNNVENLKWSNHMEAQKRSYGLGINAPGGNVPAKPIMVVETGEIFDSIKSCARGIGGFPSGIRKCLKGDIKKYKGYTFMLL